MRAEIKVLSGPFAEKLIPLKVGNFMIGRGADCQLRPDSEMVSRYHCVLRLDQFALRVRDMGSRNGTEVNGRKIQGDTILVDRDQVRIGDMLVQVRIIEDADPPSNPELPQPRTPPSDTDTQFMG